MIRTTIVVVGCLLTQTASGQSNCLYRRSGNCLPPERIESMPEPPLPPPKIYAVCWTPDLVPDSKNVIVSDVFETHQTKATLVAEITHYEQNQGTDATFTCSIDRSQQTQQALKTKIATEATKRGLNVVAIDIPAH